MALEPSTGNGSLSAMAGTACGNVALVSNGFVKHERLSNYTSAGTAVGTGVVGTGVLFRNRREFEAALALVTVIRGCPDVATLHRRYLRAVREISPTPEYGIVELDDRGSLVAISTTENVPTGFLEDYESRERVHDPLFQDILVHRLPVHDGVLFDGHRWRKQRLSHCLQEWGYNHSLQGPLLVGGRLAGTINFANQPDDPPFSIRDLAIVGWLSAHLSAALSYAAIAQRAAIESQMLHLALEAINLPAVIMDADGRVVRGNRAAHRAVIKHVRGPELRPGAAQAVAKNLEHLQRTSDRVAETSLEECDGDAVGYLVRTVTSRSADQHFLSTFTPALRSDPCTGDEAVILSAREQQIVKLVADGLRNDAIAERLLISVNTVKDHLKHIYRKLGVESRAQVAAWAERNLAHL